MAKFGRSANEKHGLGLDNGMPCQTISARLLSLGILISADRYKHSSMIDVDVFFVLRCDSIGLSGPLVSSCVFVLSFCLDLSFSPYSKAFFVSVD